MGENSTMCRNLAKFARIWVFRSDWFEQVLIFTAKGTSLLIKTFCAWNLIERCTSSDDAEKQTVEKPDRNESDVAMNTRCRALGLYSLLSTVSVEARCAVSRGHCRAKLNGSSPCRLNDNNSNNNNYYY